LSLNPEDLGAPVAIALAIDDGMLADRLAALLGGVAGVRLVARGEPADAVLAMQAPLDTPSDDLGLTPREQEVLALLAEGASNKLKPPWWGFRGRSISWPTASGRPLWGWNAGGRADDQPSARA
jgi:hypothetical protein